jgi:hypothetical protein
MNDSVMTTHPLPREPFAAPRTAAISGAGPRRPIAMVLGMHRSGTSLCAHILGAMGIDIADEIRANTSNARGHWERWEIVEFHDRILRLFNRDYFGPLHDFPLPAAWWADPSVSQIKREIVAFLAERMGDGYFGFKDPRTVRLMPLWHQIFNDLKLAPKVVLCVRNPAQVARSLGERDNLDQALGEYRWLIYMVDFFRYCRGFEVCTVDYEDWFRDPCANFEKLKKLLDVEWQQSRPDLDLVLSGIVDPALRHDESHYNEPYHPLVRSLYRLVGDYGRDGGVRDEVNNFVAQFISIQNLQAPVHQALENLAATADKYPELEREAVALRADIEQRAASEAAFRAEVEQRAATEAVLRADIEQRTATEAVLRADIEQRAATETALRSALDRAECDVKTAEARAEAVKVEVAAIQDTLAKTHRSLQERIAVASALQVELELARKNRAELEHRESRHDSALTALQAEVNSLRIKLEEAERSLLEGEAAASLREAEITSLRGELTAARDVGRAVLASLRSAPITVSPPPRDAPLLTVMLRRFGLPVNYSLPSAE